MSFIGPEEIKSILSNQKQNRHTELNVRFGDKKTLLESLERFLKVKRRIENDRVSKVKQMAYDSIKHSGSKKTDVQKKEDNAVKKDNVVNKVRESIKNLEDKILELQQEVKDIEDEMSVLEVKNSLQSNSNIQELVKDEYEKSLIENPIDLLTLTSPLAELKRRALIEKESNKYTKKIRKIAGILEAIRFMQIQLRLQTNMKIEERLNIRKETEKLDQLILDTVGTLSAEDIQKAGLHKQFIKKWKKIYAKSPKSYIEILREEEKQIAGGVEEVKTGIVMYYKVKDSQKGEVSLIIANKVPAKGGINNNYEIGRIEFQLTDPELIHQEEALLEIFNHLNTTFRGHMSLSQWGLGPGIGSLETNKDKFHKFLKQNVILDDFSFQRKFICFIISIIGQLDLVRAMEESDYPRGEYSDEDDHGINKLKGKIIKETQEGIQPIGILEIQDAMNNF